MRDSTIKDKSLSFLTRIILIGLWFILAKIINNELILPTIGSTTSSLINILKDPNFLNIILYSLLRSLFGFLISLILAISTGILSSISKVVYNLMSPILNFLRSVPTMA
ncbi:MAG TPA: ABC transporter, partial [Tissierellaceae bacterium]|nr:ABC transporter [Tissierellaceae bacterium]